MDGLKIFCLWCVFSNMIIISLDVIFFVFFFFFYPSRDLLSSDLWHYSFQQNWKNFCYYLFKYYFLLPPHLFSSSLKIILQLYTVPQVTETVFTTLHPRLPILCASGCIISIAMPSHSQILFLIHSLIFC